MPSTWLACRGDEVVEKLPILIGKTHHTGTRRRIGLTGADPVGKALLKPRGVTLFECIPQAGEEAP
jgi:hypothetical protein